MRRKKSPEVWPEKMSISPNYDIQREEKPPAKKTPPKKKFELVEWEVEPLPVGGREKAKKQPPKAKPGILKLDPEELKRYAPRKSPVRAKAAPIKVKTPVKIPTRAKTPKPKSPVRKQSPPPKALSPYKKQSPKKEPHRTRGDKEREGKTLSLQEFLAERKAAIDGPALQNILKQGGKLSQYLGRESVICSSSLKNGELIFKKILGKGEYGRVFQLEFQNQNRKYAVKESYDKKMPEECSTEKRVFPRTDGNGYVTFPQGSFLCNTVNSEFIISLIVASLNKTKESRNFINTFYFATCYTDKLIHQYTFMDQTDGTIKDFFTKGSALYDKLTSRDYTILFIQVLHAIAMYQKRWQIVHGDLHMGNIFVEAFSESDVKYFTYFINDHTITIPACPWIAKIADWGFAVKYDPLVIGNIDVMSGSYKNMPNYYNTIYDVLYFTGIMHEYSPQDEFIKNVYSWILNCKPSEIKTKQKFYIYPKDGRPILHAMNDLKHVSAEAILTNPQLMGKFLEKPSNPGKSYNLGVL